MKSTKKLRLLRDKTPKRIAVGQRLTWQKIENSEFILRASTEISTLYQEAVTSHSAIKFANLLEIIQNAAESIEIDWSMVMKEKVRARWEDGKYGEFIGNVQDLSPSDE